MIRTGSSAIWYPRRRRRLTFWSPSRSTPPGSFTASGSLSPLPSSRRWDKSSACQPSARTTASMGLPNNSRLDPPIQPRRPQMTDQKRVHEGKVLPPAVDRVSSADALGAFNEIVGFCARRSRSTRRRAGNARSSRHIGRPRSQGSRHPRRPFGTTWTGLTRSASRRTTDHSEEPARPAGYSHSGRPASGVDCRR